MPTKSKRNEVKKTNRKTATNRKGVKRTKSSVSNPKGKTQKTPPPKSSIEIKYENLGAVPAGGRQAQHWFGADLIPMYAKARKGQAMARSFKYWDHAFLLNEFGMKAWEFGQWVTQEDRFNYVCASGIALHDLAKVIGAPRKAIGLAGKLTLAIGARGKTPALAHFEPSTYAINLTRYRDNPTDKEIREYPFLRKYPKEIRFLAMGGAGSLAHEYGHALDYFVGGYIDQHPDHYALSDGKSVRRKTNQALIQSDGPRATMEQILSKLTWKNEEKSEMSNYYKGILRWMVDNGVKTPYWIQRNEMFARVWEQYVGFSLKQKGIENAFLHKNKYQHEVYMRQSDLVKVVPLFDKLARQIKTLIK